MDSNTCASLFDINAVTQKFAACHVGEDILLSEYCCAYTELVSLLSYFGKLLYFVVRDVESKIQILNGLHNSAKVHYHTVITMANYEEESGIATETKRRTEDGCRTLLRLHRALLFIIELISAIFTYPETATLRDITKEAYENNLARFHPWAVRKVVNVAVYGLSSRNQLITDIIESQPPANKVTKREDCKEKILNQALPAMRAVYDTIQRILSDRSMLQLA